MQSKRDVQCLIYDRHDLHRFAISATMMHKICMKISNWTLIYAAYSLKYLLAIKYTAAEQLFKHLNCETGKCDW